MTDAKPTPGPWRVEQDTDLVWGDCDMDDQSSLGMGIPILQSAPGSYRIWGRTLTEDERIANAASLPKPAPSTTKPA